MKRLDIYRMQPADLLEATRVEVAKPIITAAVMLPFMASADRTGWDLLFEVRSDTVSQPGEVSLPGGHLEPDEEAAAAARRETCEELGIRPEDVEIVGPLSGEIINGHRIVQPYLGRIAADAWERIRCSDEVASVFRVPLSFFLEQAPARYKYHMLMVAEPDLPPILQRHLGVEKPFGWTLYWEYEKYGIWGLTARIIQDFLDRVQKGR